METEDKRGLCPICLLDVEHKAHSIGMGGFLHYCAHNQAIAGVTVAKGEIIRWMIGWPILHDEAERLKQRGVSEGFPTMSGGGRH